MRLLVPVIAGLGLALSVTGIPLLRRPRLAERVEPYLSGLHGRPSALVLPSGEVRLPALARRLARVLPPRGDLERRLAAAGAERGPESFRVEQTAWALTGFVSAVALLVAPVAAGASVSPAPVLGFALVASLTGWLGRDWWLSRQVERRGAELRDELPPAIDLLVLALLAGESVGGAFARIAGLLRGPLAREIDVVLGDVRTGAPLVEALEGLSRRVPSRAWRAS